MSIVIKGIEMPTNCTRCPCSDDGSRFCRAANEYIPMLGKPDFCPMEEAEERKTGRWLEKEVFHEVESSSPIEQWQSANCSVCGKYHTTPYMYYFDKYAFCPNCGAKMEGEPE